MGAPENKQLFREIFAALATGDGKPFNDSLAEEVCWTIIGTTAWSGTYRGKRAVQEKLLRPLFAQFTGRYTNTLRRLIAEDDHVVVEFGGQVTTRTGKPYNNTYCWVCRIQNGTIVDLTEYTDTALIAAALSPSPLA